MTVTRFAATRVADHPIITLDHSPTLDGNINGPSLIRVPDWVPNPLGRYYLYFAHHGGRFIRLAYADAVTGPWTIHEPGVLHLGDSGFVGHIASPDVHVDDANRQIVMYFHGPTAPADKPGVDPHIAAAGYTLGNHQSTRRASSADGLGFRVEPAIISPFYLRVFEHRGERFGLTMPGFFYRATPSGYWHPLGRLFTDDFRHAAVLVEGDDLHVFYTVVGDCPESILHTVVDLSRPAGSWGFKAEPQRVLAPEEPWEGGHEPLEPSQRGPIMRPVRQLRDPGYFRDSDGTEWLLYAVAGEQGIALAKLHRA